MVALQVRNHLNTDDPAIWWPVFLEEMKKLKRPISISAPELETI
jgi:hypothetical protein